MHFIFLHFLLEAFFFNCPLTALLYSLFSCATRTYRISEMCALPFCTTTVRAAIQSTAHTASMRRAQSC